MKFSAQINFHFGSWYCFLGSVGNIIMRSQPYPLSDFNVFRQIGMSPEVSVIGSQLRSLYIGLGSQGIDWSPY